MSRIFTVTLLNEKMTEDIDGRPISEDTTKTLRITEIKKKFIIHELFRKRKKPLRIMTIKKNSKYPNRQSVINNLKNHIIPLRTKFIDSNKIYEKYDYTLKPGQKLRKYDKILGVNQLKTKIYNKKGQAIGTRVSFTVKRRGIYLGTTSQIQTNYIGRIKNLPQLIAYVLVQDIEKGISDIFLGISKKMGSDKPNKFQIGIAKAECIKMAKGKYFEVYGYYTKSGKLKADILDYRYLYWKKTRVAT